MVMYAVTSVTNKKEKHTQQETKQNKTVRTMAVC